MKIAIIDDSANDRSTLLTLLKTFFRKYDFKTDFLQFSSSEAFLSSFKPDMYDLCFMDIYMDGINGMDAARKVHGIDPELMIIFLSSSDQYMSEGYKVKALRYLLKPITMPQLNDVLPECIDHVVLRCRRLPVQISRKDREIPFSSILYVISADRPVIHLKNASFPLTSRQTFKETVAPLLEDYRFLTCSRGIVVNLSHVKRIDGDCFIMDNGDRVPISRRQFSTVNDRFIDFQFEHLL